MTTTRYDICILGAGISGLSTAAFLLKQNPALKLLIIEKESVPGGAIQTFKEKGYLAEWGPHGFLDNCEESRELIQFANLDKELDTAPLSKFVRYICLDGQLKCIPQQPLQIIRQPLIPLSAKLRFVRGLWKKPLAGNPSVAEWTKHSLGQAILPFADAVFTGTYAGDIERLKMNAVMPGIRNAETKHGSLIKGLLNRKKKHPGQKKSTLPTMTSFTNGMARFPEALAKKIQPQAEILFDTEAQQIHKADNLWTVTTPENTFICQDLVAALPVNAFLSLCRCSEKLALPTPPVNTIPESTIATVLFGFDKSADIPFGFGYLAPRTEDRFTLGTLFSSHMFPGRSPEGGQLVEALVGGRLHPERLQLSDEELINNVYQDLRQLMPMPSTPIFRKVLRPKAGIPQFEDGYSKLLRWREELLSDPSLHICGFGWKGIGINDMTKEAALAADRITTKTKSTTDDAIKKIYF